jgi:hypothetical protein
MGEPGGCFIYFFHINTKSKVLKVSKNILFLHLSSSLIFFLIKFCDCNNVSFSDF